jgi:hypothetical protein
MPIFLVVILFSFKNEVIWNEHWLLLIKHRFCSTCSGMSVGVLLVESLDFSWFTQQWFLGRILTSLVAPCLKLFRGAGLALADGGFTWRYCARNTVKRDRPSDFSCVFHITVSTLVFRRPARYWRINSTAFLIHYILIVPWHHYHELGPIAEDHNLNAFSRNLDVFNKHYH